MKNIIMLALVFGLLASPVGVSASNLSSAQVQSIIGLLEAFQVDQVTIQNVYNALVSYGDAPAVQNPVVQPTVQNPVLGAAINEPTIQKAISVNVDGCSVNVNGRYCDISVFYSEDGKRVNTDSISISSDDSGFFVGTKPSDRPICSGGSNANTDGTQVKGNPISCPTRYSVKDSKPVAYFTYYPSERGSRVITASANSTSGSTTCLGAIE